MRKLLRSIFEIKTAELPIISLLFTNFFLIVGCYYVNKSIRGALVIQKLGADFLPYVWIFSVVTLVVFVSIYSKLVDKFPRQHVVAITAAFFMATLGMIKANMHLNTPWVTVGFYVWGDIFSVVMIEQFWSNCADLFSDRDAKRLYGVIGSGGILGGLVGGGLVGLIVKSVGTANMAYVCIGIIGVMILSSFALNQYMAKMKHLGQLPMDATLPEPTVDTETSGIPEYGVGFLAGFRLIAASKYLMYIAVTLILAQVIGTLIDFQFNKGVESYLTGLDDKSAFFGNFYMLLNLVSLFVMSFVTAPVHKYLGVLAGLLVQPLAILAGVVLLILFPAPFIVMALKLADKSLSYSINRGSREVLYTSTSRAEKYKAKAVIDMLGYRASKIAGAALIIPFVAIFHHSLLNWINIVLITGLIGVLFLLNTERRKIRRSKAAVGAAPDPSIFKSASAALAPAGLASNLANDAGPGLTFGVEETPVASAAFAPTAPSAALMENTSQFSVKRPEHLFPKSPNSKP